MRKDNFEFQKSGEICENCADRWKRAGKNPIKLMALPSFTMRYHTPVAACPYCDGPIRDIAVASANRRQENAAH